MSGAEPCTGLNRVLDEFGGQDVDVKLVHGDLWIILVVELDI